MVQRYENILLLPNKKNLPRIAAKKTELLLIVLTIEQITNYINTLCLATHV